MVGRTRTQPPDANMDWLISYLNDPLHPDNVNLPAPPSADRLNPWRRPIITDDFLHRLKIYAYALDKTFYRDIQSNRNITWPAFHELIKNNILDRADTEGILLKTEPDPKFNYLNYQSDRATEAGAHTNRPGQNAYSPDRTAVVPGTYESTLFPSVRTA